MRATRLAVTLAAACVLAAGPGTSQAEAPAPLTIAVTLAPQAYVAKRLAPAGTVVVTMIPPGSSEETFEPGPSQIAALEASRLYFRVGHAGLPFEGKYVTPFLARHPGVLTVTLSDGVALAPIADERDGAEPVPEALSDPHLWMSPAIMRRAAERLAAALERLAPADRDGIAARLSALGRDIGAIESRLSGAAASAPGAAFVAYHPTFAYLARDFGWRQIGVEIEGKELGLASLVRLTLEARAARARVIFVTPGPAEKNGRVLAESIGARVVAVDPLSEQWLENLRTMAVALSTPGGLAGEAIVR